mgnify:FL=1
MEFNGLSNRDSLKHILLAIIICAKGINNLLFNGDSMLVVIVALSVFGLMCIQRFMSVKRINATQIICLLVLLLLFLYQFFVLPGGSAAINMVKQYFTFFLALGVSMLFISNDKVDVVRLLQVIVLMAFVLIPFALRADFSDGDMRDYQAWMGQTYNILPFVIASIYYLFWGDSKAFKILSLITVVPYMSIMLSHAPRGCILAIVLAPIFCLFQKELYKNNRIGKTITALFIVFAIILVFSGPILSVISRIYLNSNYNFLNKFFALDDATDGRSALYAEAFAGFLEHPLFGNGIASFWDYTMWPHNIFLQMMYENGIIVIIPFLVILYLGFILIKSPRVDKDVAVYLSFLFIISMVELMFSSYYWKKQSFWLFVWSILYFYNQNKRLIKRKTV